MDSSDLFPTKWLSAEDVGDREVDVIVEDAKKEHLKAFMEQAKDVLVEAGYPSKNVTVRIRKKKADIARDILKEAKKGKYTTVVLGRRGLSAIKEFLFGSVSHKVVQLADKVSVIVVD